MEYRHLNKLGLDVSLLGFGCMRFPVDEKGEIDHKQSQEMIDYALASGVNYVDTAWLYHAHQSEKFVGQALKKHDRQSYYLATKMPIWEVNTVEEMHNLFEQQLINLQTDYIDFYLFHAVDYEKIKKAEKLGLIQYMHDLKAAGKIKYLGFSFHSDFECFKIALELTDWDFVQIQLNYLDTDFQQGIEGYKMLEERDMPVIIMEPVKGGALANFNDKINQVFLDYAPDRSIASWAIRYLKSLKGVSVILSGMSSMEQLKDNIKTTSLQEPWADQEAITLEKAIKQINDSIEVKCTACYYCMECPYGVEIPKNFKVWNHYAMYHDQKRLDKDLGDLTSKQQNASKCVGCNECVPKCPQGIAIPQELARMASEVHG